MPETTPEIKKKKSKAKAAVKEFFTTKNLVTIAMFAAIGYGLSWLEFFLFPAVPIVGQILKLDFSNLATMLAGYICGPVGAIITEAIKQLLCYATKMTFGGVGELVNFFVGVSFAIAPSILYRYKKGIGWVIVGMTIGCACQIIVAMLCNRFITFPLVKEFLLAYYDSVGSAFAALWYWFLAFNAIKSVSVSILTFLLYKRLSIALKWLFKPRKKSKTLAKESAEVYNVSMNTPIRTKGAEETENLAEKFASDFRGGEVVLLTGDLGAGKTVFAKGVARALGVSGDVKSPTFTLCCEYKGTSLDLVHIDAYRLKSGEEAEASGLNEKFGDKSTVCLIEWPSQIESVLPSKTIKVKIDRISDEEREITINAD